MINFRIISILLLCFFLLNACISNRRIIYSFEGDIKDSILKATEELQDFHENNSVKIYALMSNSYSEGTSIVMNNYTNMPRKIKNLIKSSNRYILTDSMKIPIIFHFDDNSNLIRTSGFAHLPYTGILIRFSKEKVYYKGLLF